MPKGLLDLTAPAMISRAFILLTKSQYRISPNTRYSIAISLKARTLCVNRQVHDEAAELLLRQNYVVILISETSGIHNKIYREQWSTTSAFGAATGMENISPPTGPADLTLA